MALLPIAMRELRVAGRRPATYWRRAAVAGLAVLAGCWALIDQVGSPYTMQVLGRGLLERLGWCALAFASFAGLLTADALSRERREGTLGLLFLTSLRGYDIALGKLASHGLKALWDLLTVLPILGICLLFGGVTFGMFLGAVAVLLNTLMLSLATGLFVSQWTWDSQRSAVRTALAMILITAGAPAVGLAYQSWQDQPYWETPFAFLVPSPAVSLILAFDTGVQSVPGFPYPFASCLVFQHSLAWFLLGVTCWLIPRTWRQRGSIQGSYAERCWRWLGTLGRSRASARRRRLLDLHPIVWLSARERWKAPGAIGIPLLAAGGWAYGYAHFGQVWLQPPVSLCFALMLHAVLKTWYVNEVCRRFAEDRATGAIELLLSTPLDPPKLLRGQWLALRRIFMIPWVLTFLLDALWLVVALNHGQFSIIFANPADQSREQLQILYTAGALILVLWLHYHALGWVGIWRSLHNRSLPLATSLTLFQVLIWPWVLFSILFLVTANMTLRHAPSYSLGLGLWFLVMVGSNLVALATARRRIHREFHSLAAGPHAPQGSLLRLLRQRGETVAPVPMSCSSG